MTAATVELVHHDDWEAFYDRRMALLREGACSGDLPLLAAIRVQDAMEYGDFSNAIRSAEGDVKATYREMENRLQEENKKTKKETDEVKERMDQLKQEDKDLDDWETMLQEARDNGKKASNERWDSLYEFGKEKIRKLRPEFRKPAATVYTGGLNGVSGFMSKAIEWLTGAWNTIEQWFKQAWAKIKEWANKTADWFKGAWNTVKGWFGGSVAENDLFWSAGKALNTTQRVDDSAKTAVSVRGLGEIAGKLQNMSLNNVTLVRKGGGWFMELPI